MLILLLIFFNLPEFIDNLHDHSHGRKITRKSVLPNPAAAGYNGGAIAGRNLLSGDMLEYVQNENVSNDEAQELKNTAAEDPTALLGWQVCIYDDLFVNCVSFHTMLYFVVCFANLVWLDIARITLLSILTKKKLNKQYYPSTDLVPGRRRGHEHKHHLRGDGRAQELPVQDGIPPVPLQGGRPMGETEEAGRQERRGVPTHAQGVVWAQCGRRDGDVSVSRKMLGLWL